MANIYNEKFFRSQSTTSHRSASVIVPVLMDITNCSSVVDVGCGIGTWLSIFYEKGVEDILGLDGEYVTKDLLLIPIEKFQPANLASNAFSPQRKFDLALCLEVAEHLPVNRAKYLIKNLTSYAPIVYFSAAIPGQGGAGHINEQWPDYWSALFMDEGYDCLDIIRPIVWDNDLVEPWYRANSLIFVNTDYGENIDFSSYKIQDFSKHIPLRVVHPELFSRFASLKYVSTKLMIRTLLFRLSRKFSRSFKPGIKL